MPVLLFRKNRLESFNVTSTFTSMLHPRSTTTHKQVRPTYTLLSCIRTASRPSPSHVPLLPSPLPLDVPPTVPDISYVPVVRPLTPVSASPWRTCVSGAKPKPEVITYPGGAVVVVASARALGAVRCRLSISREIMETEILWAVWI